MDDLGPYSEIEDNQLVTLAQGGDLPAFSELMTRHQAGAFKRAYFILRDRQDAEDEVQNAFWKAFDHLEQFQQDAKFSTWLTRIVLNQCLMKIRQQNRAKFVYLDQPVGEADSMQVELRVEEASPEQEIGRRELASVIDREIHRIPAVLRDVLLLRDVKQLPMSAVAGKLGISVAAAKSRLLRARSELRLRMEKHQTMGGLAAMLG
jgi:RNA polymerase sigma-70 factor, ECF subfamily